MATSNRVITVRIINEANQNAPSPEADNINSPSAAAESSEKESANGNNKSLFAKTHIMKKTWSLVNNEAQLYAGKYLKVSEDYKAESYIQNAVSTIEGVSDIVMSTVAGFTVGGVWGAAIAATAAVVNKTVSALNNYTDSVTAIVNNAYDNYFMGDRYGLSSGGHGTEN